MGVDVQVVGIDADEQVRDTAAALEARLQPDRQEHQRCLAGDAAKRHRRIRRQQVLQHLYGLLRRRDLAVRRPLRGRCAREKALGGQPFLRRFRRSYRFLRLDDGGIGSLGSSLFLGKRGFGLRQLFFKRHARTRSWQQ